MKTKRIFAWVLCAAMLMAFMPVISMANGYFGSGTEGDPYIISSAADISQMAADINGGINTDAYFKLNKNIDMTGADFTPIGNQSHPFSGTFDGGSHTIYGLTYSTKARYSGFFGKIKNAVVKNLGLENVNITATGIRGTDVAGLVGNAQGGTIDRCYVTGSVSGYAGVSGILGSTHSSTYPTTISNCYARVQLTAESSIKDTAGISGWNEATSVKIINCYSACTGERRPIAGWSDASAVKNGQFVNTYFDVTLSPDFDTSSGRTDLGRSSVQLKNSSTYEAWDFDTIWNISADKNGGYPHLRGFAPGLSGAPSSISVKITDSDGNPIDNADVVIKDGSNSETRLSHEGEGVYSGTVTTAGESYTVFINGEKKGNVSQDGSSAATVTISIEAPDSHCVCGKKSCTSHTGTIKHIEDNSLNLVPDIKEGKTISNKSYYLSGDLTINKSSALTVSGTVNLCLNGHNLKTMIIMGKNSVLNICDCTGGGTIISPEGHAIAFENDGATVNIYGGTLESTYNANTIVDFEGHTGNELNLYSGTVRYESADSCTAIGSRTLIVNLYGGKVTSKYTDCIVVSNGKVNLCGNTEISAPAGHDSIKTYGKELIDAAGYTGGNISILCSGLSDGETAVKNVTDSTAGNFTISGRDSSHTLKREGNNLVYTEVYTVVFDANGGNGTMASAVGIRGGYTLPECTFIPPAGKKFKAWEADGRLYQPGNTVNISGNTTISAVWANIEKTTVAVDEAVQTFEYDSRAKGFAVSANVTGGFTVKYQRNGNGIASPADAGAYDVIIERAEDETYKPYSKTITGGLVITPKDITGKAKAEAFDEMTYNGNAQTPKAAVTADGLTVSGNWSKVTNVTDKTIFTANGNFTGTISEKSTGMTKATSAFTGTPAAKSGLFYNGKAQALLETAPKASGGILKYSTDNKATWNEELPKGTDAGNYNIYFKVFGDVNHNDSDDGYISACIERAAQLSPSSPAAVNETIKGKADGKITGVDSSMEYKAAGGEYSAVTGSEITNLAAGTYKVRYKEKKNYFAGNDKTIEISAGQMLTVTFDSNGGSAVDCKTAEYNQTIAAPETAPEKDGYEFAGWFDGSNLTTGWNFAADKITADKTLYAKWVRGTVSDGDGCVDEIAADGLNEVAKAEKTDISLVVSVQEAAEGNDVQTAIKNMTDAPENFGFYDITLQKSTGGSVSEASSVIEIKIPYNFAGKKNIKVYRYHGTSALELTALALRNTVKPFGDAACFIDKENGCIYIYSSRFSTYGIAYDEEAPVSSGGGATRYTVHFVTNGAGTISGQTVRKNYAASKPAAPKKEGYVFGGWYTDKALTQEYDFGTRVTKSITLYAKWTEDKKAEDGSGNDDSQTEEKEHICPSEKFNDLDTKKWYHSDTDYVLSGSLMKGIAEKTFAPDEKLTRAMIVTILYRNDGAPEKSSGSSFKDITEGAYYENAVSWAQKNGIIKGFSNTEFAPNVPITREQLAAIMYRYAIFKGMDVSNTSASLESYNDYNAVSEYAAEPLRWAAEKGFVKGRTEATLNPKDNATRAEVAAILHRFLENNK